MAQLSQAGAGYAHDVLKHLAEGGQKEGELARQCGGGGQGLGDGTHAPIGGTVTGRARGTYAGRCGDPPQALLMVVPDDRAVPVEATVDNADIGFIHAGQDVEVKGRTFEFTRYGLLRGHVVDVSRDRVAEGSPERADGKKDADAKGRLAPSQGYVALDTTPMTVDGGEQTLSPRMALTAEA